MKNLIVAAAAGAALTLGAKDALVYVDITSVLEKKQDFAQLPNLG